jgi:hypothetical protein
VVGDVILDTNLLILLVVGLASPDYVARHKRLSDYTTNDFDLLTSILSRVARIVVTPNILTETSNLAVQIPEPARSHIAATFGILVNAVNERYMPSRRAVGRPDFARFGLSDAVILEMVEEDATLLTADQGLYLAALNSGLPAENFIYLRAALL